MVINRPGHYNAEAHAPIALVDRFCCSFAQRLWYQLTVAIQELIAQPASGPLQVGLWQHFISTFAKNVNQLRLAHIALVISRNFASSSHPSLLWSPKESVFASKLTHVRHCSLSIPHCSAKEQGLTFLQDLSQELADDQNTVEAFALVDVEIAYYRLLLGQVDEAQKAINENEKRLEALDKVDNSVYASLYRVSADIHKVRKRASQPGLTFLLLCSRPRLSTRLGQGRIFRLLQHLAAVHCLHRHRH